MHVFLHRVDFRATAEPPLLSRPLTASMGLQTWEDAETATLFAALTFSAKSPANGARVDAEVQYGCRGHAESGPALALLTQKVAAEMAALLSKSEFAQDQVSALLLASPLI